jgi:hypothetical protein
MWGYSPSQAGVPHPLEGESSWPGNSTATWLFASNQASTGSIAAFAEDYREVPSASGCNLTWVMAMKPKGVAAGPGMPLDRPVMSWMFQRFRYDLRSYTEKRFANAS